jgi:hypothetical protein
VSIIGVSSFFNKKELTSLYFLQQKRTDIPVFFVEKGTDTNNPCAVVVVRHAKRRSDTEIPALNRCRLTKNRRAQLARPQGVPTSTPKPRRLVETGEDGAPPKIRDGQITCQICQCPGDLSPQLGRRRPQMKVHDLDRDREDGVLTAEAI